LDFSKKRKIRFWIQEFGFGFSQKRNGTLISTFLFLTFDAVALRFYGGG